MEQQLKLSKVVIGGYVNGWWTNCKARYRLFKGARNTGKSYNLIGLEVLHKILSDKRRNVMIIRNTFATHKYSTFSTLCKLIRQPDPDNYELSLQQYFKINQNELTITYIPTGQVILFRGFDNPEKIASVNVINGFLTDIYVEEAFEIKDYEEWRIADGSFRANKFFPDDLFIQITFCFNAWNKNHWLYEHFFKDRLEDNPKELELNSYMDYYNPDLIIDYGKGLYLHISTYKINEYRDRAIYDVAMEELKKVAPNIFLVEALGCWGNSSSATYEEFSEDLIITPQYANSLQYSCYALGVDTGLSDGQGRIKYGKDVRLRSATTLQLCALTNDYGKIVCVDEYFYSNENQMVKKTEPQLMEEIVAKIKEWKERTYYTHQNLMKGVIMVYVDSADIGFRQGLELEARRQDLFNVKFMPSTKTSIQSRVDFQRLLMAYGELLFSRNCSNLIREVKNARQGDKGEVREDFDDHALTSFEYASQSFIGNLKRYKTFKTR